MLLPTRLCQRYAMRNECVPCAGNCGDVDASLPSAGLPSEGLPLLLLLLLPPRAASEMWTIRGRQRHAQPRRGEQRLAADLT